MRRRATPRRALATSGALALACAALACASPAPEPEGLLQLSPESAANRSIQTRHFETTDEDELLSASAAVLQDLGFQVSESVREVGFLRAAKERSAREYGQEIWRALIFILSSFGSSQGGGNSSVLIPVDLHQQINASLVTRPLDSGGRRHEVRVLFYRLVWQGDGQSGNDRIAPGRQSMQMIRDATLYQQFFARLAKAVFLEANEI